MGARGGGGIDAAYTRAAASAVEKERRSEYARQKRAQAKLLREEVGKGQSITPQQQLQQATTMKQMQSTGPNLQLFGTLHDFHPLIFTEEVLLVSKGHR